MLGQQLAVKGVFTPYPCLVPPVPSLAGPTDDNSHDVSLDINSALPPQ